MFMRYRLPLHVEPEIPNAPVPHFQNSLSWPNPGSAASSSKFTPTRLPLRYLDRFPYGARGGGLANAIVWSKCSHDGNR